MGWITSANSTLFTEIWQQGRRFYDMGFYIFHRNIILDQFSRAKIADFGLAMETSDIAPHGEKLPVKWTAPEAQFKQRFSSM